MRDISTTQAISLWSELEQAYYDDNKYGGHTAEIYIYRLMPHTPTWGRTGAILADQWHKEIAEKANGALLELLLHFATKRNCTVLVDGGREPGKWMVESDNRHRWHITVQPRSPAEE